VAQLIGAVFFGLAVGVVVFFAAFLVALAWQSRHEDDPL